jgi:hypothetical protein
MDGKRSVANDAADIARSIAGIEPSDLGHLQFLLFRYRQEAIYSGGAASLLLADVGMAMDNRRSRDCIDLFGRSIR